MHTTIIKSESPCILQKNLFSAVTKNYIWKSWNTYRIASKAFPFSSDLNTLMMSSRESIPGPLTESHVQHVFLCHLPLLRCLKFIRRTRAAALKKNRHPG